MRALFRVTFAATGIAFCGLVALYGYRRFGKIPPLPSPSKSQMDSTEGPSANASYAALVNHKTLTKAERQHLLEGQFTLNQWVFRTDVSRLSAIVFCHDTKRNDRQRGCCPMLSLWG